VASGLVLASSAALLVNAEGGWIAWLLAASTCTVALTTRLSPLVMLSIGAALFVGMSLLLA